MGWKINLELEDLLQFVFLKLIIYLIDIEFYYFYLIFIKLFSYIYIYMYIYLEKLDQTLAEKNIILYFPNNVI